MSVNGQHHTQTPLLVLLGGATCGGKSTVADRLQNIFVGHCARLSQDHFFREEEDPEHLWITLSDGRKHQDWENITSVDWIKMRSAVRDEIEKLSQDYEKNPRGKKPLLILEGHLVLANDWTEFCDHQLRFFFTIDKKSCLVRRQQRTYVPADPPTFFEDRVWPAYVQHNQEVQKRNSKEQQVYFIDGASDLEQLFAFIENLIKDNL